MGQALRDEVRTEEQVATFVAKLRTGEGAFEDEASEGRSKSLGASLSYGFGSAFGEEDRKRLALLHLFQGFSDPQAKYNVTMEWRCKSADYPVAYFVGFKVRQITGQTILVSREKGTVNIISLKTIDPDLDKPTSVKDADNHAVLCADIATGCIKTIFYGRY